MTTFSVDQNVIPSYISVPFTMFMQEMDGLQAFNKMIQDAWK
jgi:hypothetical protein